MLKLISLLCLCSTAWSSPLKTEHALARFIAIATPGNLKIEGSTPMEQPQAASLEYDPNKNEISGTISVKLEHLDTGIELRNNHLKHKYLQVVEFPEAVFSFTPTPLPAGGGPFFLAGSLTLHGKTSPVRAEARWQEEGAKVELQLQAKLRLAEFAIEAPHFMGVKVRDEVEISFAYRGAK